MYRNGNGQGDQRNNTLAWRDKRDRDEYEAAHTERKTLEEEARLLEKRFFRLKNEYTITT